MKKIKESPQSVRFRLFISLCIIVALIILFLIVINNVVLESFYLYSKIKNVKLAYEKIDEMYVGQEEGRYDSEAIENELNKISVKNNFDILVIDNKNTIIYSTSKNLTTTVNKINEMIISSYEQNAGLTRINNFDSRIIFENNSITIRRIVNEKNNMNYIFLTGVLDNGNLVYIRIQLE